MNRLLTVALLGLPAFCLTLALPGCSGDEKKKEDRSERRERPKKESSKTAEELTNATDGTIKGRVTIEGPAPKVEEIVAMAKHNDAATCLAGDATEKSEQYWILAPDGKGVANVVVKLMPAAGKKFKNIDPAVKEVTMDQPHCAFVPHAVALAPGQTLKMLNSAKVAHNTKTQGDPSVGNEPQSKTIPPGGNVSFTFNPQKTPIKIACDFHPWMTGLVYASDSPYIAVTDKDGNYEIKNVPTGVELVVVGMHEVGEVEGGKDGLRKTFTTGANTLDLKVKAK